MDRSGSVCVVHLVRARNGIAPCKRFLDAYRRNPPGIPHRLLLLFKGFTAPGQLVEYEPLVAGLEFVELHVPDRGYDIGSYMTAFRALRTSFDYFCFLNSYSEPLHPNWLRMLWRHLSNPDVGLVGATGSYQSLYSDLRFDNYLHRRDLLERPPLHRLKMVAARALLTGLRLRNSPHFPPFPNPHIRTNGFMLPTPILSQLHVWPIRKKLDAYRFESGKRGLTQQVMGLRKQVLVVGADGAGYEAKDWDRSQIFRQGNQENLLIADNQTRAYEVAQRPVRQIYSLCAWGRSRPHDAKATDPIIPE